VQLALRELDLLARAFLVEEAAVDGNRDLVEITDLHENVIGDPAESDVLSFLRKGTALPESQLVRSQAAGEV
jgi:hypothetical protein